MAWKDHRPCIASRVFRGRKGGKEGGREGGREEARETSYNEQGLTGRGGEVFER